MMSRSKSRSRSSVRKTKSRSVSRSKSVKRSKSKSKSRSKTRTIAVLKPGMLTSFGYHIDLPMKERHTALKKAYKAYGYSKLIKRLNILVVYNKYKHPEIASIAHKDMEFIQKLEDEKRE
jgi:hypothetical protein